jgi:molybdopterin converting factor small subunit
MSRVRVEFYGLARLRAGIAETGVVAATVGEALEAVEEATGLCAIAGDAVAREFLVSLGGTRFTTDLGQSLADGDCLLILGADAGG